MRQSDKNKYHNCLKEIEEDEEREGTKGQWEGRYYAFRKSYLKWGWHLGKCKIK